MVEIIKKMRSDDGNCKYLLKSDSVNHYYEALLFSLPKAKNEYIICLSSQAGCQMHCAFCATGQLKHCENIPSKTMVETVEMILLDSKNNSIKWVSFMGMGEPLMNYDNIVDFYHKITEKYPFKLSLSTVGISDKIVELSKTSANFYLFFSLHFIDEQKRDLFMPINKRYNIDSVLSACKVYLNNHPVQEKIEISYMLLEGINDSLADIENIVKKIDSKYFSIQLLLYNEAKGVQNQFRRISIEKAYAFEKQLKDAGFETFLSVSVGRDVLGGCGQMTGDCEE